MIPSMPRTKTRNMLRKQRKQIFTKLQKGQKSFAPRFKSVGIAVHRTRFTLLNQNFILLLMRSLKSQI